jgi:hypothetical protein
LKKVAADIWKIVFGRYYQIRFSFSLAPLEIKGMRERKDNADLLVHYRFPTSRDFSQTTIWTMTASLCL